MSLVVDNSTLQAVARCDTEALVRYTLGYTSAEEHAALLAGTAIHRAFEAWFKTRGDNDAGNAAFAAHYRAWAESNVQPDHRLAWPNTSLIVANWFANRTFATLPYSVHPSAVELAFDFEVAPSVRLQGRLDALGRFESEPAVVEHKSTGAITPEWERQWRLDSQVTGYMWAASRIVGQPIKTMLINGVEFSKVPTSTKKCPKHAVPYSECGPLHAEAKLIVCTRTPEQIDAWHRTAVALAHDFDALESVGDLVRAMEGVGGMAQTKALSGVAMQGTFNGACKRCALASWCANGRDYPELVANFLYEPWSPLPTEPRHHSGTKP